MDWDGVDPADQSELEGTQGICPAGWYVPTDNDIKILEGYVDSTYGIGDLEWDKSNTLRGDDVGTKLKSSEYWDGTDDYNFNTLPAGYIWYANGSLSGVGSISYWWSSSPSDSNAWGRYFNTSNTSVYRHTYSQASGFSIRCLLGP